MKEDKENKDKEIGQLIKEEVERQGISPTTFAEKIHVSRTAVYNIYGQETMNSGMLAKISEVLRHNFFEELCHRVNLKLGIVSSPMANLKLHSLSDIVENVVDGDLYATHEFAKEREGLKALLKEYFESDQSTPLLILEAGYTFGAREVVKQVASKVFPGTGSTPCPKLLDAAKLNSESAKVFIDYIDRNTFDSVEESKKRLNEICYVQSGVNKKMVCIIHTDPIATRSQKKDVLTFDQWGNEMSLFPERHEQFFIVVYRWNRNSLLSWAIDAGLHEQVLNYISKHQIPKDMRKDYQLMSIRASFFEILMGLPQLHDGIDYPTAQAYSQSEWEYASDFIAAGSELNEETQLPEFIQDIIDFNEMCAKQNSAAEEPKTRIVDCNVEVDGYLVEGLNLTLTEAEVNTLSDLYHLAWQTDLKGLDEYDDMGKFFPWLEEHSPEMAQALVWAAEAALADLLAQDLEGIYTENIPHVAPQSFDDYWAVEVGLKYNIMPCDLPKRE